MKGHLEDVFEVPRCGVRKLAYIADISVAEVRFNEPIMNLNRPNRTLCSIRFDPGSAPMSSGSGSGLGGPELGSKPK